MSTYVAEMGLIGPFTFTLNSGESIAPRSAKAQGLLALLATSPNMTRPRRWLEDKLWSDRGAEQASASLRQTLSEIRRAIPKEHSLMFSDRSIVSLTADKIDICLNTRDDALFNEREFLEGIDIRDQEFESWLQIMRSRLEGSIGVDRNQNQTIEPTLDYQDKLIISCIGNSPEPGKSEILAEMLATQVGQNVSEQVSAYCKSDMPNCSDELDDCDLNIDCKVVSDSDTHLALVQVSTGKTRQVLFSRTFETGGLIGAVLHNDELAKVTFDAAECVALKLPKALGEASNIAQASGFVQIALSKIFQFERNGLVEADHILDQAFHLDPNGAYLAWKALIRTIQSIELFEEDTSHLRTQAEILLNQALSQAEHNASVLSIAALVRAMLFDDDEGASDFAMLAIEENPRSAFALQAISITKMLSGDNIGAYESSKSGHTIARSSRYRHWWDLYHCLVCIGSKRFGEALDHARAAHRRAPMFRPPLRNLIALHTHFGNGHEALKCRQRLLALEPDFSIERFVEDANYPNRTLKQAGLLNADFSELARNKSSQFMLH